MREFTWPVRVYYEDTDAAGVVYHSNYLKFMERARTEWLRAAGYSQTLLEQKEQIVFVVAGMSIKFAAPAFFDDLLRVDSAITGINRASIMCRQTVLAESGEIKCSANVDIVCVDTKSFKPKRIPEPVIKELIHDN